MVKRWHNMKSSITYPIRYHLIFVLFIISAVVMKLGSALKLTQMESKAQCEMSEFTCTNGKCVSLDKYCNNFPDCDDASDEPRFCSRCNRTYYGNIGVTYDIELHRPKEDKVPYTCVLTFTAAGGLHGDIVQVTLESFTLGKFTSYTENGCPDGFLQISEASRSPIGGMWCGSTWGPAIFYSETRSIILTVKLNKLSRDQNGYNFDFRLKFKVLSRDSAVVRYGGTKYEEIVPWATDTFYANKEFPDELTLATNKPEQYESHEAQNNSRIYFKMPNQSKQKDVYLGKVNYTEPKYYLGDLIPGTYCSRIFSNCDKKNCRLQSPNFPGIYPRNLTCYYAVRQHDVPPGKHALITVSQPKSNSVWITTDTSFISTATSSTTKKNDKDKITSNIKTWDECDHVQDYITIYDGYTTRDPTILKFCGGGSVPESTSSGPELLVEFTSSPYGTFSTTQPNVHSIFGFQIEVEVIFVDIQSPTYAKTKRLCEFWIRGTGHGVLENPKHSLSQNTTCLYHLQGTEASSRFGSLEQIQIPRRSSSLTLTPTRFKIWISILKFELAPKFGAADETISLLQAQEDCSGMLRIWDGALRDVPICKDLDCTQNERDSSIRSPNKYVYNHTNVIARFCRGSIPRSCDHGVMSANNTRPCLLSESFVSSSDFITLELKVTESTVLRPLSFTMRYEFVDYLEDGQAIGPDHNCFRKFVSSSIEHREPTLFRSARNIFKFGRGGTRNMSCVYRFEAQRGERVRIIINKISTGNRTCTSRLDTDIFRSYCLGDNSAKLEIFERPWKESILLPRGCVCNSTNSSHLPIIFTSTSHEVEVKFSAINMTLHDDPDSLNFEATFEFFNEPINCKDVRRKTGFTGEVRLAVGDMECRNRPWLIESESGKYLYVRMRGFLLRENDPSVTLPFNTSLRNVTPIKCKTKSRVVLTNGEGFSITVCPLESDSSKRHLIEFFSAGWRQPNRIESKEPSSVVSVEFLEPDDGDFSFSWLELSKRPLQGLEDCHYRCPELEACVNSSIWCDGIAQCPSGYDESFTHCSAFMRLPAEILVALLLLSLVFGCVFMTFIYKKVRRSCRRSSVLQTRLKSLSSMDTAILDEKDVIC